MDHGGKADRASDGGSVQMIFKILTRSGVPIRLLVGIPAGLIHTIRSLSSYKISGFINKVSCLDFYCNLSKLIII